MLATYPPDLFRKQVNDALNAVRVASPSSFVWFGDRIRPVRTSLVRTLPPDLMRAVLVFSIQSKLYTNFYCKGFARSDAAVRENSSIAHADASFVRSLSMANRGLGCLQTGWDITGEDKETVIVSRNGLSLFLPLELPMPGDGGSGNLMLRLPREHFGLSPGFYTAVGDKDLEASGSVQIVRLYWNVIPESALELMRAVTSCLNPDIPFRLKVLNHPGRFNRCDAATLYLAKEDFDRVRPYLTCIYRRVAPGLSAYTPVFAKPLGPGLGLAEEPARGESFGLHRCSLLAEGIVQAFERHLQQPRDRSLQVESHFAQNGISLDTPYLNPGSHDQYRIETAVHPVFARCDRKQRWLAVAKRIGKRLAGEALWAADCCTWVVMKSDAAEGGAGYRTAMPDLYDGTSGIALFLAELYRVTGEQRFRQAAVGGIRQALRRAPKIVSQARLGLFTGATGVAFAAIRIAELTGEPRVAEDAVALLRTLYDECSGSGGLPDDFLSGLAGALAAVLVLKQTLGQPFLSAFALQLGRQLVSAAGASRLTGFAHGASGVAYSLLELFAQNGDPAFRRAGERLFECERRRAPADSASWCNGTSGIALARLRAYELTRDPSYRADALTALDATRREMEAAMRTGTGNYSLCHGLAGNAEVFVYAQRVLGEDSALPSLVAQRGYEIHKSGWRDWPCGAGPGETPGLMLGLAGIGYFYLRLYDAATPAVCILLSPAADTTVAARSHGSS